MNSHVTSSPVSLSYVAALRGVKPRQPGESFVYADMNCREPELLSCLAASNPEGRFYGLIGDEAGRARAEEQARMRGVENVVFISGAVRDVLAQVEKGAAAWPFLNYLACDESRHSLNALDRNALFGVAEKLLQPGGLFHYTYRAYDREDGALRFLVREFAPEMNADQAREFLVELKKLGSAYLARHADVKAKLDACIAKQAPDEFFSAYDKGDALSATFNTIVALRPRGFAYAGDSNVASNYIELAVPAEAQELVVECRDHVLYEPIKDYALDRTVRSDIWCRQPVPQVADVNLLFGGFTYGIIMPRESVPAEFNAQGKVVELDTPLYAKLIELMTLMPVGVGDFLAHPNGKDFAALDVVGAIQILVACGIAQPMRGVQEASDMSSVAQPRLVGGFNQYLDKTSLTGTETWMASPVLGNAIAISARDALVMQALGRAGLANSVSALLPELERLAKNPSQAASVMDAAEPTAEMARCMIEDVVSKSIVQWYAYGLLEAA